MSARSPPPTVRPENGRSVFFLVEPDRHRLSELARRVEDGRPRPLVGTVRPLVGTVRPLAEAPTAFGPGRPRTTGRTTIQVANEAAPTR